ncbi:MAG: TetR family transcriptional regulator [Nocardioides sp.]
MATEATRTGLVDAALREFAAVGVAAASLVEITRQAGQRNRGAVHYHFGGREGLLAAVLEKHADFLGVRERELLAVARTRVDDVPAVIEALVRPSVELAEDSWSGRCYLMIVAELVDHGSEFINDDVTNALARTGGYEVYELLRSRLPDLGLALDEERLALFTAFFLSAIARRARAIDEQGSRAQLPTEQFIANLVTMSSAMLTVPPVA